MMDCEGCYYWKEVWKDCGRCCHYAIINNQLRKRDGDKCLSFIRKEDWNGGDKQRKLINYLLQKEEGRKAAPER